MIERMTYYTVVKKIPVSEYLEFLKIKIFDILVKMEYIYNRCKNENKCCLLPETKHHKKNIGRYCRGHNLFNKWKNNRRKFINLLAIVATAAQKLLQVEI